MLSINLSLENRVTEIWFLCEILFSILLIKKTGGKVKRCLQNFYSPPPQKSSDYKLKPKKPTVVHISLTQLYLITPPETGK